jgi:predicted DNA-binding transcriptional regulator AlpA
MSDHDIKLKPAQVAEMLGISPRTLSRWHALRVGPPRCKLGRRVLYRKSAIDDWLLANEIQPTRTFSGRRA